MVPSHCSSGAVFSMSCARMVSLCEYQRLSAKKMVQVPSVTMKGGSVSRVTSKPLISPQSRAHAEPDEDRERRRKADVHGEPCP